MSETEIDKFLAETTSLPTKLQPWESQIFELLSKNATYEQIKRYLETKNVNVERGQINYFVKAQKRSDLYEKAMQQRKNRG